jgi:chorismate mutase
VRIDELAAGVLRLLAEGFALTRSVGELKAERELPPVEPASRSRKPAVSARLARTPLHR